MTIAALHVAAASTSFVRPNPYFVHMSLLLLFFLIEEF